MPPKHEQFRPTAWEVKTAGSHAAAKIIIDAETAAREAKTSRLRIARHDRAICGPKADASRKRPKQAILRQVFP
jgi:hypothetical protein